jgi:hypothetical protein
MANSQGVCKRICVNLCVVLLVVLFCAIRAQGQADTASIAGTVTDPSGGAVVGAKVEATNVGTNVAQSTVSDSAGRYKLADLVVGTYNVQASNAGFKIVVHTGVVLAVGGSVVVDFALPVGQITQSVSVEADVSRVETETSEVSTLVSPQQMRDLPLNGRNFEQLITLAPGVATIAPANNFVTGRMYGMQNNYSSSGARPTGQMFLLDNTDIRDFWEHGTGSGYAATSLGVEAIGEFQLLTNTYTSQFAGNGVVINATSRSGTNDFHGGAYEFFRNNVLDARDISDPLSGPPPFRRNQFGGDIGGPIKKDKLFFFANYEGLRQLLAVTSFPFGVPEPYTNAGELPCFIPATGAPNNSNPACPVGGGGDVGSAGNPVLPVPGASQLAQDISKLYGLCTTCRPAAFGTAFGGGGAPVGYDQGGFQYVTTAQPLTVNEDYVLGRIDYNLGPNDTLFGRYVFDDARVVNGPQDPLGIFPELEFTRDQFFTLTEKHILSPTMVNSIRFGYTRANENSRTAFGLNAAQESAVGLDYDPLDFTGSTLAGSNYAGETRTDGVYSAANGIVPVGPDADRPDTLVQSKFSGGDDFVWTHGAHTIKFGVVITRVQTNNRQIAYSAGQYALVQLSLQDWISGEPFLDFAVPPGFADGDRYFREIDVAPYIQDDWKVTPRLTLNFGLRLDYATNPVGWAGGNNSLTTLVGSFRPPIGPQATAPNCSAITVPAEYAGCLTGIFTPVKHAFANNPNAQNWGPRFGFAFDPFSNHKTSIRGGFGIFHDPVAARIYESGFIATPPSTFYEVFFPCFPDPFKNSAQCLGSLQAPFGIPGFNSIAPAEFAGVDYQVPNGSPYEMQYNLNIQREIAHGTVLSVGYVGEVARHLWTQEDINVPKCFTYPDCTALPQNPGSYPTGGGGIFVGQTSMGQCPEAQLGQATCYGSGVQFPTPFGGTTPGPRINGNFGEMVTETTTAASSYNSLQVSLNRQFAHNLAGQINYTWSHCIDDGSFATSLEEFAQLVTNPYNQSYDYGNCTFDLRHNLSANALYSLPFKGNRFVEGWQLATILGMHKGVPINIYNGSTTDPADLGTEWATRANYTFAAGCSPNQIIDKKNVPGQPNTTQWFNPQCYEPQAPGYYGNVTRDSVPGPGTIAWDFSILKDTKITESVNLQFRAEFFNIINHYNPGAPAGSINTPGAQSLTDGQTTLSQAPVVTPRQIQFALKLSF